MKNKAFGFYTAALTLILTVATLVAVLIYGSKGGMVNSLVPIALGAAAPFPAARGLAALPTTFPRPNS